MYFGDADYTGTCLIDQNTGEAVRHGYGKQVWKNGDRYEGEWSNDELSGQGVLTYKNGDCYEG